MYKRYIFLAVIIIIVHLTSSCQRDSSKNEIISDSALLLGSVLTISSFEGGKKDDLSKVFQRVEEIEQLMSTTTDDYSSSEILAINAQSMQTSKDAYQSYSISKDLELVLRSALEVARLTDGAFDPSIAPLVTLWGWPSNTEHVPRKDEIENILPHINWKNLSIDKQEGKLTMKGQTAIDVGGIAKGYAANVARDMLIEAGVSSAIIDFGGNIITLGEKKDKTKWNIGIQTPFKETGEVLLVLKSDASSVVTSGNYERFFEENGKQYSHIIDPRTGYSIDNNLLSVTVIGDDSMFADACSTGLIVLGLEEGMKRANSIASIEAIFVSKDQYVYLSDGIDENFVEIKDNNYRINSKKNLN